MGRFYFLAGDSATFALTINDENGSPLDLTDKTVFFTVKKYRDLLLPDDQAVIHQDITEHSDATAGQTQIILSATQTGLATGEYLWNIRVVGVDSVPTSTPGDVFRILPNPTQRV